jgi:branched-subunit amino acid ABC-type transport system permease component
MARFLGYLTIGVIEGLLYGLLALGIVLIYKGSRILNFAQTSFGLVAAFLAWWFAYKAPLPFDAGSRPRYALAVVLSLAAVGLNGFAVEHGIIRRLRTSPRLVLLVTTLAVSAGNAGLVVLLFNRNKQQQSEARMLPSFLNVSFTVGTKFVKGADVEILLVVPIICALLALFFTRTRFGVAVRAVADNRDAARLLGVPASRVSVFTWVVGSLLAGLAGLMITSHRGSLDVASLSTGFLVTGLIAALVGGLTSLPGAVVGGLVWSASSRAWRASSSPAPRAPTTWPSSCSCWPS